MNLYKNDQSVPIFQKIKCCDKKYNIKRTKLCYNRDNNMKTHRAKR